MLKFFVYSNVPDGPSCVLAIFDEGNLKDALVFVDNCGGYREIRQADWVSGVLPERHQTKLYKPTNNNKS